MEYTKKLNNTTQKAQNWIKQYNDSNCYSVSNFYGSCSQEKLSIKNDIKNKMLKNDCNGYRVLSGNCFHFVCAYMNYKDNILYVETIGNTWEIKL